jgi:hypothetical protein
VPTLPPKRETATIDRLWQGESGNAPWQRRSGQVKSATNVRFDMPGDEAAKRNATTFVIDLDQDDSGNPLDADEDYYWLSIRGAILAISDTEVFGWDESGNVLTVSDDSAGSFASYLPNDPVNDIDVAVSYDTAIVLNVNKVPTVSDAWTYQQSLNFIVNGDHTDTASITADTEPQAAVDTFNQLPGQEVTGDSSGAQPANGDVYRVLNDIELIPSGYYLYYDGAVDNDADGFFPEIENWFRVPKSGQRNGQYDDAKMPHRIIYDEDNGTLTTDVCPWRQRISGTAHTNAPLKWVDDRIRAVDFNQGRLFLTGADVVTSSREDDFFNLWLDNINAVADNDRISTNITQSDSGEVLRTAVCGDNLLIIAENAQIEFTSGEDPLTNINGRPHQVTAFQATAVTPGTTANVVYITDEFGDVHQYRWLGERAGIVYSSLLTAHNREALYGYTVDRIYAVGDSVFITTDDDDMVTHDLFVVGDQLIQSAWGVMSLHEPAVFVNAWAGNVRIITKAPEGYSLLHYVHRRVEPPTDLEFEPYLDRMELVVNSEMTYDEDSDTTTLTHTGRPGTLERSMVVSTVIPGLKVGDVGGGGSSRLAFIPPLELDSEENPVFPGDLTEGDHYLGFIYDTDLTVGKLYPKLTTRELLFKRMAVFHRDTTDYKVTWTKRDGTTGSKNWQAHRLGETVIGEPSVDEHYTEFFPDGADSKVEVKLSSSSPGPVHWTAMVLGYDHGGEGLSA